MMKRWDGEEGGEYWSEEENKAFERALAIYGEEEDPERWLKVAAMIPGKSVYDVIKQYRELEEDVGEIEAGLVPFPGYEEDDDIDIEDDCSASASASASSFTLELIHSFTKSKPPPQSHMQLPSTNTCSHQPRRKGVPWTQDEHRRFLKGLIKYGKGDWRNISRNYVVTKTPTQVASHAQKYFIRQQLCSSSVVNKDNKRRPSIHDITTLNLISSDAHNKYSSSGDRSSISGLPWQHNAAAWTIHDWNHYSPQTANNNLFFMGAAAAAAASSSISSPPPNYNNYYNHHHIAAPSLEVQGQNLYSASFQTRRIRG